MPDIAKTVEAIAAAATVDARVALIRRVPEEFGMAQHAAIYGAIARQVYVPHLAPDFAYLHWRDEYELEALQQAYDAAFRLTSGFTDVDRQSLAATIRTAPAALRIFRLILGFTTQEFAASTRLVAEAEGGRPLSNGRVKSLESGAVAREAEAGVAAGVIDAAMSGALFAAATGDLRSKLDKPDTAGGWPTVRRFATDGVPLSLLLHQRHYGGAFRQLLDATSTLRGDVLEDAVEELFIDAGIRYLRTGSTNQEEVERAFGITVKPAPDFVVYSGASTLKAILECKGANDGGTARDKAARFRALRNEATRLGGVPLFAVLGGLGWTRTADALGPVVRDTDGRTFTIPTLSEMLTVQPLSDLWRSAPPADGELKVAEGDDLSGP